MSTQTAYLITGANRGIGHGLVSHYLSKPNNLVIAGVRDVSKASHLSSLPTGPNSRLLTVKIDATQHADPSNAASELTSQHGIHHLDVVISSAGIAPLNRLDALPLAELQQTLDVNALATLALFQGTYALLRAAKAPKFVLVGAAAGTFSQMEAFPFPNSSYSAAKLLAHWLVRKMQLENEWLTTLSVHPGWVQTDMGNAGAKAVGMEKAAVTMEDSMAGTTREIDEVTRETSAVLRDYEGKVIPW